MPPRPIVGTAAGNVGPAGGLPEYPPILFRLIARRHVAGHLRYEVFGEPGMMLERVDNLLSRWGVSCCQAISAMTLWPRAFHARA